MKKAPMGHFFCVFLDTIIRPWLAISQGAIEEWRLTNLYESYVSILIPY